MGPDPLKFLPSRWETGKTSETSASTVYHTIHLYNAEDNNFNT